jgi:hypothetical protein
MQFKRPQGPLKTSYRGKNLAFQRDAGLFQWSTAVKALAKLAVGTRAVLSGAKDHSLSTLEGEGGSPAATLDYAIAKPTSWIVDLFGREASGKSYARLVCKRENSERKRPGPVRVTLSTHLHDSSRLRIFLDGVELLTTQELLELLELLETDKPGTADAQAKAEPTPVFKASWFKGMLHEEVLFSLRETELLDRLGIEEACSKTDAPTSSSDQFLAAIKTELLSHFQPAPQSKKWQKVSKLNKPLRIACPPTATGALALFNYMQSEHAGKVTIDAAFPSTRSILEADDLDSYSCVVLSWAAARTLYIREKFTTLRPVMLLPRTSLGFVLRKELSSTKQVEKVLLATEVDGYPMRFLARAMEHDLVRRESEAVAATFSEIMSLLPRKGDAAIVAFPISHLIGRRHGARVLWSHDEHFRCGENILFIRNELNRPDIISLVREAWYTLLEDPTARSNSLDQIFSAVDFTNYLYRLAGGIQVVSGSDVIPRGDI